MALPSFRLVAILAAFLLAGSHSLLLRAQAANDNFRWQQQQQMQRQMEMQRQRDMQRQQEMQRQRDLQRQQEMQRQREAQRQREMERQREMQRQVQRQREVQQQQAKQQAQQERIKQQRVLQQQAQQRNARNRSAGGQGAAGAQRGLLSSEQQRRLQQLGGQNAAARAAKSSSPLVMGPGGARLVRPLTAGEIQRGFTGKVTANGMALVRVGNRVMTVPAARVGPRATRLVQQRQQQALNGAKQGALKQRLQRLAAGGAGRGGGGGLSFNAANDNRQPVFRTFKHQEHYEKAVALSKAAKGPVLMLGRNPNYLLASFHGRANRFHMDPKAWDDLEKSKKEAFVKQNGRQPTGLEVKRMMFDAKNRPVLEEHVRQGSRIVLASPYLEMKNVDDSYSQMEIEYLESQGYRPTADGLEMIR